MAKKTHLLHQQVAETIYNIGHTMHSHTVLVDQDCMFTGYPGIKQRLPFFLSYRPARESAVSDVDVVLIKDDKIKLVCEIEESGFNPTKIFGKLFSTASAKVCRLNSGKIYELDENAVFIQMISAKDLPVDSLKAKQGQLIENEINNKLSCYNSWIKHYRLSYGLASDFTLPGKVGYDELERIIRFL